jgi:hypothetical protein
MTFPYRQRARVARRGIGAGYSTRSPGNSATSLRGATGPRDPNLGPAPGSSWTDGTPSGRSTFCDLRNMIVSADAMLS